MLSASPARAGIRYWSSLQKEVPLIWKAGKKTAGLDQFSVAQVGNPSKPLRFWPQNFSSGSETGPHQNVPGWLGLAPWDSPVLGKVRAGVPGHSNSQRFPVSTPSRLSEKWLAVPGSKNNSTSMSKDLTENLGFSRVRADLVFIQIFFCSFAYSPNLQIVWFSYFPPFMSWTQLSWLLSFLPLPSARQLSVLMILPDFLRNPCTENLPVVTEVEYFIKKCTRDIQNLKQTADFLQLVFKGKDSPQVNTKQRRHRY